MHVIILTKLRSFLKKAAQVTCLTEMKKYILKSSHGSARRITNVPSAPCRQQSSMFARDAKHFHIIAKVMRLGRCIASVQMEPRNDAGLLSATGTDAYVIS